MQLSFFNTTHLSGETLVKAQDKAVTQDQRILSILKATGRPMTPFQVLTEYNKLYPEIPITSVRRSMTVLTSADELIKCLDMKTEKYGSPNHYWRVKG